MFGLAAGHLAKFVQSVFTVSPEWGAHSWYFVPAYLLEAVIVPTRCYVAIYIVRRFIGPGPHCVSRIPSLGIVMTGAVFLVATVDFTAPFRFGHRTGGIYRVGAGAIRGSADIRHIGTLVMDRLLSEDRVVGSWDSGVTGYVSRFPVVNLDGLVNSHDYLRARKDGDGAAFRQRLGITHLANTDWPTNKRRHLDTALFEGSWHHDKAGKSLFSIWLPEWRWTAWSGVDRSAWFWERMEPHLERQADDTGLLVDGRLVQAFVRDCTPDEPAVWTWAGGGGGPVLDPWTQTSIGFCTSALKLPPNALPPVRVVTMPAGEYLAERVGDRRPAIHSDFDVYLVENTLIYVKEACGQEDVDDARFFLHVEAVVSDDLPGRRKEHGFDNLDFRFYKHSGGPGVRVGGTCLVEVPLPDYGIAAIRTGQFVVVGDNFRHLWEGEIRFE